MGGEETLTKHIAIGRFLLLTKKSMNILPEYPGALYRHFHMRNAKKLQDIRSDNMKTTWRTHLCTRTAVIALGISCLGQFEIRPTEKLTLNITSTSTCIVSEVKR